MTRARRVVRVLADITLAVGVIAVAAMGVYLISHGHWAAGVANIGLAGLAAAWRIAMVFAARDRAAIEDSEAYFERLGL